jgi:hypothetical protein
MYLPNVAKVVEGEGSLPKTKLSLALSLALFRPLSLSLAPNVAPVVEGSLPRTKACQRTN